jgi:hypothetical protein
MPRTPRTVVRPPPEPEPNPLLEYFGRLAKWGRIHPIRAGICALALWYLGWIVVWAIGELL